MSDIYQLSQVSKSYDGQSILSIDRMSIRRGEILAIVGPSGAGKSTLLRLLAMLESPTSGTVSLCISNKEYTYHDISKEIKRRVGMIFQRPLLLSRSVRANIEYGLKLRGKSVPEKTIFDLLERLAIQDLAQANPQTLSGGEIQRVAIARAMILQPAVLLLDEPTSNLDPQNIAIIEQFLRELHQTNDTSIIIVTHNIFQAKRLADRVAFLHKGQLIEVADTDTFFTNPADERTRAFTRGQLLY